MFRQKVGEHPHPRDFPPSSEQNQKSSFISNFSQICSLFGSLFCVHFFQSQKHIVVSFWGVEKENIRQSFRLFKELRWRHVNFVWGNALKGKGVKLKLSTNWNFNFNLKPYYHYCELHYIFKTLLAFFNDIIWLWRFRIYKHEVWRH